MSSLENERYFFVPLNKYDMVIEKNDGTVIIPPHEKKRYLFCSQAANTIYMLNNMEGSLFTYNLQNQQAQFLLLFSPEFLRNQIYFHVSQHLFYFLGNDGYFRTFDSKGNFISEQHVAATWRAFCFDEQGNFIVVNDWNIQIWKRDQGYHLTKSFPIDGIGEISITSKQKLVYVTDSEENLLRAYDWNGNLVWEAITPHIDPIGQIWVNEQLYILYGGLWNEVGYSNLCWQEQKPFFHPIFIHENNLSQYKLVRTNWFLVDFYYEEHFEHVENINHFPLIVKLKLPDDDHHQQILEVLPLGLPFSKVDKGYAEFVIPEKSKLPPSLGFKARVKLSSIKIIPKKPLSLAHKTLLTKREIEELEADHPFFNFFIEPSSKDDIEKIKSTRNCIYKRLRYEKNKTALNFREVWQDGYGTCGDYASLMLIALYKNNIASQSVTGYKVTRFYFGHKTTYSVYYNHTWLEVFDESDFHIPLETSTDDKEKNDRYSFGQFFGLDWTHVKLYQGKAFPNFISFPTHPELHPFDVFRHPSVFITILDEE